MLSTATLPGLAVDLQTFRIRATCGWPPSCVEMRCSLFRGAGRSQSLLIGLGGPWRLIINQRRSSTSAVPRVNAVQSGSVEERQEQEMITINPADEGETRFEEVRKTSRNKTFRTGMENRLRESISKRKGEQKTYSFAAIASTTGFMTLAAAAVVYRFVWQLPASGEIPYVEVFGTLSLAVGAAIGMEFWARWAHKALWHASLWSMHKSHHEPRDGPFETNDIFAIINAVPAISLMLYGFLNEGILPGLCFGAGLGITMFGIAYMFVHDGLVHHRFPVGPIAGVPYLQKVAAAHQLHHADLFEGVPYGLFLGPKELEKVGGKKELQKLLKQRTRP